MKNVRLVFLWAALTISTISFGCVSAKTDYYPLNEGWSWEYLHTDLKKDVLPKITITNLASRELQGTKVIPRKIESEGIPNGSSGSSERLFCYFVIKSSKHIAIFADQGEKDKEPRILKEPIILLKFPITSGNTWKNDGTDVIIESINEKITVPGGTFKDCIKVKATDERSIKNEEIGWYALGVGLIKFSSKNINTSTNETVSEILLQLVSLKKK